LVPKILKRENCKLLNSAGIVPVKKLLKIFLKKKKRKKGNNELSGQAFQLAKKDTVKIVGLGWSVCRYSRKGCSQKDLFVHRKRTKDWEKSVY